MKLKDYEDIYFFVNSKRDEKKWIKFLSYYFPNHYAKKMLVEGLYHRGRVGLHVDGYGWLSQVCAHYGHYQQIKNFRQFKKTKVYKDIVNRGATLKEGTPRCVHINVNEL